jgi:hypothetical protein
MEIGRKENRVTRIALSPYPNRDTAGGGDKMMLDEKCRDNETPRPGEEAGLNG